MPKRIVEQNYLRAFMIMFSVPQKIDTVELDEDEQTEDYNYIILNSEELDPETTFIKKDNYQRLSNEAKEVIGIILNSPSEVLDLLRTPKHKKISRRIVQQKLSLLWNSKFLAEKTIEELRQWANLL